MQKIAIIGAGISGLTLAQQLKNHADVVVFEKARGVGGRMSTRYVTVPPLTSPTEQGSARSVGHFLGSGGAEAPTQYYFDHGTQFFTARSKAFQQFLQPFQEAGVVQEWQGKVITLEEGKDPTKRLWFEPHYVATPNMNSLCKALAAGITIHTSCEIAPLSGKKMSNWELQDQQGKELGVFDWVISTAPPAQTIRLFGETLPQHSAIHSVRMQGCYALMLGFNTPWEKQWIAANVQNNPIAWIAVNSSKPGRHANITCLVVHSQNDWAEAHIDDDVEQAQLVLLKQFYNITGINPDNADYISTHRWRYAIVDKTDESSQWLNEEQGLAATGDWCGASRIEDAWLHATALAEQLIQC